MRPRCASVVMLAIATIALMRCALGAGARDPPPASRPQTQPADAQPRVLVFSKTAGFRHDSIPHGIKALMVLGAKHDFAVEATEDPAMFTEENLRRIRVVVFLNTTGDVLDDGQQHAFEDFIHRGGGFVGVHAATDTEYDWPWYTKLVGAQFEGHPEIQQATIKIIDREHAATKHLAEGTWTRTDEWYNFKAHPVENASGRLCILATLDESTYEGGTMKAEHPVIWCQEFDGGRAFYTALGHTKESYAEPDFLKMLLGGIQWAMGGR